MEVTRRRGAAAPGAGGRGPDRPRDVGGLTRLVLDGTPRPSRPRQRDQWISVCRHHFDALRTGKGNGLLSDYAATRPSEFFAVCTEVFFTRGVKLLRQSPDLYAVISDYYGQDPARWSPRR